MLDNYLITTLEGLIIPSHEKMKIIWTVEGLKPVGVLETEYSTEDLCRVLEEIGLQTRTIPPVLYSQHPHHIERMIVAMQQEDDRALGILFGYPECCIDYYMRAKEAGKEPKRDEEQRIIGYLKQGLQPLPYFNSWVHCDNCLTDRESPSWLLEERMKEALRKNSKSLYEEFMERKNAEYCLYRLPDGGELLGLISGTKEERTRVKAELGIE
jgi:hypothetical protein